MLRCSYLGYGQFKVPGSSLLFTGIPAGAQHATSATVTATFQAPLGATSVTVQAEKNRAHKNLLE